MDVERTMEFILQQQAQFTVNMALAAERAARADERMDRADERMDRADERAARMEARLDKRMNAITTLIKAGMKMISQNSRDIKALAAAQALTDKKFNLLLSQRNGNQRNGNGHKNGRK